MLCKYVLNVAVYSGVVFCKAKMQYLPSLQVSIFCNLALPNRVASSHNSPMIILAAVLSQALLAAWENHYLS